MMPPTGLLPPTISACTRLISIFLLTLLAACAAQPQPTLTAAPAIATATLPPTAAPLASPTPASTQPPEGIFALKFYPPLVLEYDPTAWSDASEYNNPLMMVNFLQHRALQSCSIGVMGPSGFYPSPMQPQTVGEIEYDTFRQEGVQSGQTNIYYFALDASLTEIHNTAGIPILVVQAYPAEIDLCQADAEIVLATLRR